MHRAPADTAYNSAKDKRGWGCIMEIGLTEAVRKMAQAGALPAAREGGAALLLGFRARRFRAAQAARCVERGHKAVRHHQDGRGRLEAYRRSGPPAR